MSRREFQEAYVETALWSSTDASDDGDGAPLDKNYSRSDIAPDTMRKMMADCDKFYDKMSDVIDRGCEKDRKGNCSDGRAGHDFWLTRNGHGAGFWDGDWPEPEAAELTRESKRFGEYDLYVGDDGKIHGT